LVEDDGTFELVDPGGVLLVGVEAPVGPPPARRADGESPPITLPSARDEFPWGLVEATTAPWAGRGSPITGYKTTTTMVAPPRTAVRPLRPKAMDGGRRRSALPADRSLITGALSPRDPTERLSKVRRRRPGPCTSQGAPLAFLPHGASRDGHLTTERNIGSPGWGLDPRDALFASGHTAAHLTSEHSGAVEIQGPGGPRPSAHRS
jgi:hypothetical protein